MSEDTIEIQICWYVDEDGKKVYDIEHMQEEFEYKLNQLLEQDSNEFKDLNQNKDDE